MDVRRDNQTTLFLTDFRVSNDAIFNLPAGSAGLVAGYEHRRESFEDDRDPRLDGTIVFTDFGGDTFPFVSDVVNSSPTPDNDGERDVNSFFVELQAPLLRSVDVQVAGRFEDFSDIGSFAVGKLAMGWRPSENLLLRASWSQAVRVPNLVTVNETIVARQNTRTDYACLYADPDQAVLDCRNSIQRTAQGSKDLVAEQSDNYSLGVVFAPTERLTLTLDYWSIEKSDTIGLFGEENHTVLDLLRRLRHGTENCASLEANPAVVRADEVDEEAAAVYLAAGICPAGDNRANKRSLRELGHPHGSGLRRGSALPIGYQGGTIPAEVRGFVSANVQARRWRTCRRAGGRATVRPDTAQNPRERFRGPTAKKRQPAQQAQLLRLLAARLVWRVDFFGEDRQGVPRLVDLGERHQMVA